VRAVQDGSFRWTMVRLTVVAAPENVLSAT
jgi:hypothetical protein